MEPKSDDIAIRHQHALLIAREAGDLLRANLGRRQSVSFKGSIDLVTDMDRRSEQLILESVRRRFPEDGILAEETVAHGRLGSGDGMTWVVDPLDGTTNYAHGYPVFCVSLAIFRGETPVSGIVYDPVREDLFTATETEPSTRNGERMVVSDETDLTRSLLATGFPYDVREDPNNNLNHFGEFLLSARAVRRAGSAALDLCYVAWGVFDGFWELKLSPWDTAAAAFIVQRAGGVVTDFAGGPHNIFNRHVVASNGKIHSQMLGVLERNR
jgi:myo-inositol-1(or 4)-monophosphatase